MYSFSTYVLYIQYTYQVLKKNIPMKITKFHNSIIVINIQPIYGAQFAICIPILNVIILEKDHNPKLQVEPCARKHHQKRHHKGEAPLIKNPSGVAKYVFEYAHARLTNFQRV